MTDLPDGWAWGTINDLIADSGIYVDGDWIETKDQDPTGDIRLTQLADVGDGTWLNRSGRYMTKSAADRLGCTPLMVDDVLVARMPDPLGRACLFPGDDRTCVTVVDVAIVRPGEGSVSPRWLMWAINAPEVRSAIEAQQAGTTRKRISRKNLGAIPLPIAPRAEQERIVAAIEEAFSKLDAGEAGLRTVRRLLKRMRDAVLAAAVTGRLVPQDPTDTRAIKVLTDLRAAAFVSDRLPPLRRGWASTVLGGISQMSLGKMLDRKASTGLHPTPYLRNINVRWGAFDLEDIGVMDIPPEQFDRVAVISGDLVVCEGGQPGRCAVWRGDPIAIQKALHRVRPLPGVSADYLALVLAWWTAQPTFERYITGTTIKHIPKEKLELLPVPLPPPQEQDRIVAEVDRLSSFLDACERAVDAGLTRSAALRRSILKAAFEGRLVPQDPTDEPASVLVERIRAERATTPPPARRATSASKRSRRTPSVESEA